MAALLSGCGAEANGQDPADGFVTRSEDLQQASNPGNDVFAREIKIAPTSGPDIFPTLDPAICGDKQYEYLVASRDAQQRFRVLHHVEHRGSDWKIFDDDELNPRTFNSRPACAMLEPAQNGDSRFVLVGKGTNNRLYASVGRVPPTNFSDPYNWIPSLPTVDQDWDDLNTRTYGSGGTDPGPADPALASHEGSFGGMVLAFISGSTVYAHYHALPYAGNVWQQRVAAPPLPNGATPIGTPAITFLEGWAQVFHVVVRAQVNGQNRLYETYFGITQNGPSFCGILCGGQSPTWTQLPITGTISSSPALEFYSNFETLYFRRNSNLMQTSGFATQQQLGTLPLLEVHPGNSVSYTGAPAALGGVRQEFGNHLVISRTTSDDLYLDESFGDEDVMP